MGLGEGGAGRGKKGWGWERWVWGRVGEGRRGGAGGGKEGWAERSRPRVGLSLLPSMDTLAVIPGELYKSR